MLQQADLIIQNANVYTVDEANPHAQAVAVCDNQISFVGTDEEVQAWCGPNSRVIDGKGRTLMPGFIDSHFHLLWGSHTLYGAQLQDITTWAALADSLQAWATEHPAAPWVIGQGASYGLPSEQEPLTRHHLDSIIANRPLVLVAYDQHSMFANTVALKVAGIFHGITEPLPNGTVVVDEDGVATGELYEMDAMDLIRNAMPEHDFDQSVAILKEGLAQAASYGITSIHNMDGDLEQAAIYAHLEELGQLTTRVYLPFWVKPEMNIDEMVQGATTLREQYQSDMLRGGAVKFFMDGVLESYTAVVLDGYPDQPDNYGEPIWDSARFAKFATVADQLGFQIAVHACGDGAVRRVLDGYAAAQASNNSGSHRHRVEHIELIHPDDAPRFAQLGIIASMQPLHAPLDENDPDIWPTRVHKDDWDRSFAWRTLRDVGARLAFGSDWPVVTQNPFLGLHAALNRQPWAAGHDAHQQTLTQVLRSYTYDGAYTEFQEEKKGLVKVGMLADLVLLSEDIFAIDLLDIANTQAVLTVCDGQIVFENLSIAQSP